MSPKLRHSDLQAMGRERSTLHMRHSASSTVRCDDGHEEGGRGMGGGRSMGSTIDHARGSVDTGTRTQRDENGGATTPRVRQGSLRAGAAGRAAR